MLGLDFRFWAKRYSASSFFSWFAKLKIAYFSEPVGDTISSVTSEVQMDHNNCQKG